MVKRGKEPVAFRGSFVNEIAALFKSIKRSKSNLAVKIVFGDGRAGMIFFSKAKLVHAEFGDMIGERALSHMLKSRGGSYEIIGELAADVVSIEKDIEDLIAQSGMEAETSQPQEATGEGEDEKGTGKEPARQWSPPPSPPQGFQEEAWMTDWGENTPGFLAAAVMRRDGVQVMGVTADDIVKDSLGNLTRIEQLLENASVFTGAPDDKGVRKIRIESSKNICLVSALAENYFLTVFADASQIDVGLLEQRFQELVDALNTSLETG